MSGAVKKKCLITTIDRHVGRRLGISYPLSREDLEVAQMAKLRTTISYAMRYSSFYRQCYGNLDPEQFRLWAELEKNVPLDNSDVVAHGQKMLCVS